MKNILKSSALFTFATLVSVNVAAQTVSTDTVPTSVPATAIVPAVKAAMPTFGYFSYAEVMEAMPEHAIAMKSLDDMRQAYDKELASAEADFSRKFAEFLDGQKSFPENIMLKRQKELQQLMDQSIKFKNEAKQLIANAENELMEPIRTRLDAAIQSVGYEQNYLYILNTDTGAYPYIGATGVDCTTMILKKLGME